MMLVPLRRTASVCLTCVKRLHYRIILSPCSVPQYTRGFAKCQGTLGFIGSCSVAGGSGSRLARRHASICLTPVTLNSTDFIMTYISDLTSRHDITLPSLFPRLSKLNNTQLFHLGFLNNGRKAEGGRLSVASVPWDVTLRRLSRSVYV